ncbi:hypothetical protein ABEV37_18330 [Chromobacterium piscinae]
MAAEFAQRQLRLHRQQIAGAVALAAGAGQLGDHEMAFVIAVAQYQCQRLVRLAGGVQPLQLGVRLAIGSVQHQVDADLVQTVADELQHRFAAYPRVLGVIAAAALLQAVEITDQVELDVTQYRVHRLLLSSWMRLLSPAPRSCAADGPPRSASSFVRTRRKTAASPAAPAA